LKSGLPRSQLAELHGNCYLEKCEKCHTEFLRAYDCTARGQTPDLSTGSNCEKCKGRLLDSIINFGENLPESEFSTALEHSKKADLSLVLGTSMRVKPACNLPLHVLDNKGSLFICNLQQTPFDEKAMRIQGTTDDIMYFLLKELGLEIPKIEKDGVLQEFKEPDIVTKHTEKLKQIENSKRIQRTEREQQLISLKQVCQDKRGYQYVKGETKKETIYSTTKLTDLMYFTQCTDCRYSITGKVAKVIIENCTGCTLIIVGQVATNMLEIINCSNVIVKLVSSIYTLTIDSCNTITIGINKTELRNVFTNRSHKVTIFGRDFNYQVPDPTDDSQYVSHLVNGKIITERVVREGAGYCTTEREKAIADERDRRQKEMFDKIMTESIKIQKKDG